MKRKLSIGLLAIALSGPLFASADEVVVYSARNEHLIKPLFDRYTESTGVAIKFITDKEGPLLQRLKAEGARSPADMLITVDAGNLWFAAESGVLAEIDSPTLEANVPANLRDPQARWFGLSERARTIVYGTERVQPGELSTYEDLADPKWQGRICTRSGTHAYNLALMAAMIHHHGADAAKTWAQGVKANLARKPQGNDRAQVKAIWAGECDVSLGNTYYMGQMLQDPEQTEWANSVRIIYPAFEDGGTHLNVSGAAMTAASKNADNALTFLEFLVSDQAQQVYATINYEFPVKAGVPLSPLVASWGSFTPDDANLMDLAPLRDDALRIMEEVDFDG